jgi:transcriptional regulator with XRE-family HTH domain
MTNAAPKTRIQELREARGWSRYRLALVSGVSYPALSNIEHGKTQRPNRTTLTVLAQALGTTPAALRG